MWTKPGSTTKQKTTHRVPLSAPARLLLVAIHDDAVRAAAGSADGLSAYVFPGRGSDHRVDIKRPWRKLCLEAGIVTSETVVDARGRERVVLTPSARLHDLRHTFASILASAGMSLPIIGALLGHSQQATTARYAHLMEDPLRRATESVGALVMPSGEGADVIEMRGAGR
ncbi:MAG: tyrosine-type recombinase/integrase [Hyphomicrobium sp.]